MTKKTSEIPISTKTFGLKKPTVKENASISASKTGKPTSTPSKKKTSGPKLMGIAEIAAVASTAHRSATATKSEGGKVSMSSVVENLVQQQTANVNTPAFRSAATKKKVTVSAPAIRPVVEEKTSSGKASLASVVENLAHYQNTVATTLPAFRTRT